jgi:hypothetical protein
MIKIRSLVSATANLRPLRAVLAAGLILLVVLGSAQATEVDFRITTQDTSLIIKDAAGSEVSALALSTIGQKVNVPPVTFRVSYGRDASGLLSVIISPHTPSPMALTFEVGGKKVAMDKNSIVTLTFQKDRSVVVDPGFVGIVKIDEQAFRSPALVSVAAVTSETSEPVKESGPESPQEPPVALLLEQPMGDIIPIEKVKANDKKQLEKLAAAGKKIKKEIYWAEPVTPPEASQKMQVSPTEMKLAEVQGVVKVQDLEGKEVEAMSGALLGPGSKLITGPNSSAAVFIGGVHSIRLASDSIAAVTSSPDGTLRVTLVDLTQGLLFSKVGRTSLETQDFKIRTPQGVVTALGTDFGMALRSGRLAVMCVHGVVELFTPEGESKGRAEPKKRGAIAYLSSAPVSPAEQLRDILVTLASASQFNTKINTLLDQKAGGQPWTPSQQAYLTKVVLVPLAITAEEKNGALLFSRQLPPPEVVSRLLDNANGGGISLFLPLAEPLPTPSLAIGRSAQVEPKPVDLHQARPLTTPH